MEIASRLVWQGSGLLASDVVRETSLAVLAVNVADGDGVVDVSGGHGARNTRLVVLSEAPVDTAHALTSQLYLTQFILSLW